MLSDLALNVPGIDVLGAETWKDANSSVGECFFLFLAHANI
jgi:hypothetical protein